MRSVDATAAVSLSARPVTVVIDIPVLKGMPISLITFAPDVAGIMSEKKTDAPAVGVDEAL